MLPKVWLIPDIDRFKSVWRGLTSLLEIPKSVEEQWRFRLYSVLSKDNKRLQTYVCNKCHRMACLPFVHELPEVALTIADCAPPEIARMELLEHTKTCTGREPNGRND